MHGSPVDPKRILGKSVGIERVVTAMSASVRQIGDVRVLQCSAEGPAIATDRDASDLVSLSYSEGATLICIPVGRLSPDFFQLRTGFAGAFIQKLVNYRRRLAIVGDVSAWAAESRAFRDFVYEANNGRDVWFVASADELESRLASSNPAA